MNKIRDDSIVEILQVCPVFYPAWHRGGTVRIAYNLSKNLVSKGYNVTTYTTDSLDQNSRIKFDSNPYNIDGINVYYFKNISNFLASGYHLPIPLKMHNHIKKEIKNFDIIHLHDYRHSLNIIMHHYASKYDIPYILQPHGSTLRVGKKGFKWLFDNMFGYKIFKDASRVIAVSKEEEDYDKKMGIFNGKIEVIYNGMDLEPFKNLPKYGNFRKKHNIDNNKIMILFLGRINKSKGIDFVIRTFSKLVKEINNVCLVIAGSDDGFKVKLEKLIEELNIGDIVKFTGFVNEADKISAYVDADLFVHTVRYMGGVGLTPLEAILCDTPVIVTEGCGEVIKEANAGYIVKFSDEDDFKEKMIRLIKNPDEGNEMVERGKEYILKNLTWDNAMSKVLKIYSECVQ